MGNVNLPTPVALAGGAICVLGGYLLGVLAGPGSTNQTTATVVSYDAATERLCLKGDGVTAQQATGGSVDDGVLCGTWRRTDAVRLPQVGDVFRFVSLSPASDGGHAPVTLIYGDVVPGGR
jgi:hypothetical protein